MTDYSKIDWSQAVTVAVADLNETKQKGVTKKYEKKETDLTKYFSLNLEKEQNSGTKTFRMLPDQENPMKFVSEVYFHYLQVGKEWKKIYDPQQNDPKSEKESPLNNARKLLNSSSDKEISKTAAKFKPRLFYIIRGIERGKESEGVKFWRFGSSHDGKGLMDKIESLINYYEEDEAGGGALWNPIAGRDIIITLTKNEKKYTVVSNLIASDRKPLSKDKKLMELWLSDTTKWSDVYKTDNPIEYLRVISEGGIPVWSKAEGKYVAKVEEGDTITTPSAAVEVPVSIVNTQVAASELIDAENVGIEDLPF